MHAFVHRPPPLIISPPHHTTTVSARGGASTPSKQSPPSSIAASPFRPLREHASSHDSDCSSMCESASLAALLTPQIPHGKLEEVESDRPYGVKLGFLTDFLAANPWANGVPLDELIGRLPVPTKNDLLPATSFLINTNDYSLDVICSILSEYPGIDLSEEVFFTFALQSPPVTDIGEIVSIISSFNRAYLVTSDITRGGCLENALCTLEILLVTSRNVGGKVLLALPKLEREMLSKRLMRGRGQQTNEIVPSLIENCTTAGDLTFSEDVGKTDDVMQALRTLAPMTPGLNQPASESQIRGALIVIFIEGLLRQCMAGDPESDAVLLRWLARDMCTDLCPYEAVMLVERHLRLVPGAILDSVPPAAQDVDSLEENDLVLRVFDYSTLADCLVEAKLTPVNALRMAVLCQSSLMRRLGRNALSPSGRSSLRLTLQDVCGLYLRLVAALIDLAKTSTDSTELLLDAKGRAHEVLSLASAGLLHSQLVQACNALSVICLYLQSFDEAVEYRQKAYEIICAKKGYKHRSANELLRNLGNTLVCVGRMDEAESTYMRVVAYSTKSRSTVYLESRERVFIYQNLANGFQITGDKEREEKYRKMVLVETMRTSLDKILENSLHQIDAMINHDDALVSPDLLWERGRLCLKMDCYDEAIADLMKAFSISVQMYTLDDPKVMSDMEDLVGLLFKCHEYNEAINFLESLNLERKTLSYAPVAERIGVAWEALGLFSDAEDAYGEASALFHAYSQSVDSVRVAVRCGNMMLQAGICELRPPNRMEKLGAAVNWFRQAALIPGGECHRLRAVEALLLDNRNLEAKNEVEKAIQALKDRAVDLYAALKLAVRVEVRLGNIDQAIEHCNRCIEVMSDCDAPPLVRYGFIVEIFIPTLLMSDDCDLDECLNSAQQALQVFKDHYGIGGFAPEVALAHLVLGSTYLKMLEFKSSAEEFQAAFTMSRALFPHEDAHPLTMQAIEGLKRMWVEESKYLQEKKSEQIKEEEESDYGSEVDSQEESSEQEEEEGHEEERKEMEEARQVSRIKAEAEPGTRRRRKPHLWELDSEDDDKTASTVYSLRSGNTNRSGMSSSVGGGMYGRRF